jgi:shikimate kinase
MPGSGKSTLGKQLAVALKTIFVDLDEEIENQEKQTIPEVFRQRGEAYFRKVESSLLNQWASSDKKFVMATGGGAPCFHDGMKIINESGKSIFLDVPISDLIARAAKATNRPLLEGDVEERLKTLYEKRMPIYRQATLTISGKDIKVESILEKLNQGE